MVRKQIYWVRANTTEAFHRLFSHNLRCQGLFGVLDPSSLIRLADQEVMKKKSNLIQLSLFTIQLIIWLYQSMEGKFKKKKSLNVGFLLLIQLVLRKEMFSCSPLSCRDGIIVSSKPHHEPEARQEMKTGEQGWNNKEKKKMQVWKLQFQDRYQWLYPTAGERKRVRWCESSRREGGGELERQKKKKKYLSSS